MFNFYSASVAFFFPSNTNENRYVCSFLGPLKVFRLFHGLQSNAVVGLFYFIFLYNLCEAQFITGSECEYAILLGVLSPIGNLWQAIVRESTNLVRSSDCCLKMPDGIVSEATKNCIANCIQYFT